MNKQWVAAACALLAGSASAEVGLDSVNGWRFSTDGWVILQAHRQNGDIPETTGFRITSGTTPSLMAFNVAAPASGGLKISSRVGLYINPHSGEGNFRNAGNVGDTGAKALDPREIWAKVSAGWGEVVFGKAYSIYQGEAVLADASVLAGGLTGYDHVNTPNAFAASFNGGYMWANFNAGVRYNSPQDAPLRFSVGVYDPSQIRNVFVGAGAAQTRSPRVEAGVYYRLAPGAARIRLYADAIHQDARGCLTAAGTPCASTRVTSRGVSAGATVELGDVSLVLTGFRGQGLGSVLLQDVDALDAAGRERDSSGYFGQVVYRLQPGLSLRYSYGRTRIDDTAATTGHTGKAHIAGAYYTVHPLLTVYGELARSTFTLNPVFGRATSTDYATAGVRFMW
jgi:hypothetical protein